MNPDISISKNLIINKFIDYVLLNGKRPSSIYAFAKENDFEEAEFYNFYGNFKALEKDIFRSMMIKSIELLNQTEEYKSYDSRTKLLSFYFTFFEILAVNRSYVLSVVENHDGDLKKMEMFNGMKTNFIEYSKTLHIDKPSLPNRTLEQLQDKTLSESLWIQLLLAIKFWMKDESPNFEKTDIYIEKSINTSFDLLNVTPLRSVIDFGKFIWNEKVRTQ